MRDDAAGGSRTPYQRALSEPRFLLALRAAYAGPDEPLDALWWLERPLEPGPSGAHPPAAVAAEARRALYGRDAPPQALERYRQAADREAETRAAIVSALAAVGADRPPLRRRVLGAPPPPDPGEPSRRVAPSGRWQDVFLRARGTPRVAPLVRLPRATLYAVETDPPTACMFLITDLGDFQGFTTSVEEFEREGATLVVDPPLDGAIGLASVTWRPNGEVRWEARPIERNAGPF